MNIYKSTSNTQSWKFIWKDVLNINQESIFTTQLFQNTVIDDI